MIVECINQSGAQNEDDYLEFYNRSRIRMEI